MLELEDDQPPQEAQRHRTVKDRRSPFGGDLEPWLQSSKIRSEQTSIDYKGDRPVAVNRFLATVKTAAHSRADKKRSKRSLVDEPTFCLDQRTSKEIYPEDNEFGFSYEPLKTKLDIPRENLLVTQESTAEGRRSVKKRNQSDNIHPVHNNLMFKAEFHRPVNTIEQDIRFRSNLQKLLKLRDNVRKKKLSVVERTTDRPVVSLRHTQTRFNLTQTKVHQVPLMTLDQMELEQASRSEGKYKHEPNKNYYLMTYKFLKEKSREREEKLHRSNLDNKLADINKLINCIKQHGVDYSQLLGNQRPQLKERVHSRDRHRPF